MNQKKRDIFVADSHTKLAVAMQMIDDNANGILFITDEEGTLCGSISDGDVRRWILKAGSIDTEVANLMNSSPFFVYEDDTVDYSAIMLEHSVRAIPVVDEYKRVVDIVLAKEIERRAFKKKKKLTGVPVVIMAGGKGTRLYPYTKILPKPLIPIGEIPIVERVINGFNEFGINEFYMSVNYKKGIIMSYFADVQKNYNIEYVEEDRPLGTGGSIRLIEKKFTDPIFIVNCDSLIRTDYSDLYKYHIDTGNDITMVTALKNDKIPYGVIHVKPTGELGNIEEKPVRSYLINTGMYIINPAMIDLIPENTFFHMTNLVDKAIEQGYKVGMYPVSEDSFLDMGEFAEMKRMEMKLNIK